MRHSTLWWLPVDVPDEKHVHHSSGPLSFDALRTSPGGTTGHTEHLDVPRLVLISDSGGERSELSLVSSGPGPTLLTTGMTLNRSPVNPVPSNHLLPTRAPIV